MRKLIASVVLVAAVWLVVRHARTPHISPEALLGLWAQADGKTPSAPLRFYYFHTGGKGLYRYGQVGYNQTHSFDWSIDGSELRLVFRKTGEKAATKVELSGNAKARTLTMLTDPRGDGVGRYVERKSNLDEGPLVLGSDSSPASDDPRAVEGRLWMDYTRYATGGSGFVMYQLSKHACVSELVADSESSSWRLGWYHRGDFDDWSTENLCYRADAGTLQLQFPVRGDRAQSTIGWSQDKGKRVLTLDHDPRNFFHRTRLVDSGPSF